jgi:hypothetical protein
VCYHICTMGSVSRITLSFAGVGALIVACAAPTLPLPPPAIPIVDSADLPAGEVKLSVMLSSMSGALPNAIIQTYDPDPSLPDDERVGGAQADESGSWDSTIYAFHGDEVEVTQEIVTEQAGLEVSPSILVQIP